MIEYSKSRKQILLMGKDWKWWVRTGFYVSFHPWLLFPRFIYSIKRSISDIYAAFGYYKYPHRIIFIAGLAMSATTWMKNLFARVPGYYTRPTPMPEHVVYNQDICDSAFSRIPKNGYSLFKTHLEPKHENIECIFRNGVDKVVVTYRDLRDVAVSRYNRLLDFPKPSKAFDYVDYRTMPKEKALDHSIEVIANDNVAWIRGWFEIARLYPGRVHFVRFEEMKKDTERVFRDVLIFYGIELADEKIAAIVEAAKGKGDVKKNLRKAPLLPWGLSSNFRSGKVGNWREELSDAHIQKCKDRLGAMLIELGYEKDLNW